MLNFQTKSQLNTTSVKKRDNFLKAYIWKTETKAKYSKLQFTSAFTLILTFDKCSD